MYITVVNNKLALMSGNAPYRFGISQAFEQIKIKPCGWFWRKYALYVIDPDTVCMAAVGGSVGSFMRVSPRFKTTLEVKKWLEAQPIDEWFPEEYDGYEIVDDYEDEDEDFYDMFGSDYDDEDEETYYEDEDDLDEYDDDLDLFDLDDFEDDDEDE